MTMRYLGSGPYCYANSLAMVLGSAAPEPAVIEVLTGSPFGAELIGGVTPFFNPPGWDPGIGLDAAINLLGWTCQKSSGGSGTDAAKRLREAGPSHPLLAGPVEFGLLLHIPGSGTAIGSDHYVVVTGVENNIVRFHDPHGHPYATLPINDFITAWRAESIGYATEQFTARTDFQQVRAVDNATALRRSLPAAARWLAGEANPPVSSSAAALERLAELVENGLEPSQHGHLSHFAIRVGARRLNDAATCLSLIEQHKAADIAGSQAQLIGAMQHPLVTDDRTTVAQLLRRLAPTYEQLRTSLPDS
ncbi:hypothetical protein JOF56_007337 [Kibdelosporangium banguiense]|uniref:RADC family protein n=1 Tax=Kibdelosporangium banguiense TaxID=1365924 RepID=A0ABS4TRB6_9PSEU|nr:hypothetical protein [Kibdelosporangium banguiense]MBP2326952.1 hypothetical protein [Kibdelosporangium banguiense]